jgi:predicted nucleic acid-binding protein
MIVADANLTLYLYVEGQHTQEAQAVLRRDSAWVVPPLWQSEFLNVLWQYIRQDIFTEQDALRRYKEASRTVQIEENPPAEQRLHLAVQHNVTVYDATYAALARHLGVQHVTYDGQVLQAGLGIHPHDFLTQVM